MAWKVRRDPGDTSIEVPFEVKGKVGRIEDPPPAAFFKRYVYVTQPSPMAKVEMRFAEFLRRAVPAAGDPPLPPVLGPGETYYLYGKSYLLDAVQALGADLRKPACLGSVAEPFRRIWISTPGCVTPLHYDLSNGFLCQVRGTKQVWLFDPSQFDRLYPRGPQFPGLDNFER